MDLFVFGTDMVGFGLSSSGGLHTGAMDKCPASTFCVSRGVRVNVELDTPESSSMQSFFVRDVEHSDRNHTCRRTYYVHRS